MAKTDMLVRAQADFRNYDANMAKASRQLDQFKKDNLSLGGVLKQSTSALTGMAAQFASVTAAIQVVGTALKKNEQLMDEWGRTTQTASAIFDSFVNSLNTGDFSGFFTNIRNVVSAAREAYDAMDELQTFNAFNQINLQKAQTGFTNSITSFREGNGSIEDVRSAANKFKNELKARMELETDEYVKAINTLAKNSKVDADMLMQAMSGSYGDYKTLKNTPLTGTKTIYHAGAPGQAGYATEVATAANDVERLAVMLQQLDDNELNNIQALGLKAKQTADEIANINKQVARVAVTDKNQKDAAEKEANKPMTKAEEKVTNALENYANSVEVAKIRMDAGLDDEEKYKTNLLSAHERLFTAYSEAAALYEKPEYKQAITNEAEEIKALSQAVKELKDAKEAQKQADREFERATREAAAQVKQVDMSILGGLTGVAKSVGWTTKDLGTTGIKTRINAGVDITEDEWKKFEEKLNERLKELHMDPIEINFETGSIEEPFQAAKKDMSALVDNVQGAISAFGQLGSAMQSIEDPSAKVAGIIMGAIASVAAGLGQAIASHGGRMENGGPWAWIGFAISATATMISTIAAIKSATAGSYANGGVVGGNSYSGDNLIAHVNSGETILSAAQSDVIANKLTAGNGGGGGSSQPYLTGDVIILGVNNYLGRSGQGEIVTTSMLRRAGIRL